MKGNDLANATRWLKRAQPPRGALLRALVAGVVGTLANGALAVGALALLVESATRPGLRAVAIVLVVIELLAFLRSPLRYLERMSAHRLGYAAVTRWRRWLVRVIGQLDYSRWRTLSSGDLLERALGDTDELQNLWLRGVVPAVSTTAVVLAGDLLVALLPPLGEWWRVAVLLLATQVVAVAVLLTLAQSHVTRDQRLRAARGHYRAQLIELGSISPELNLLGRSAFATSRYRSALENLTGAERSLDELRRYASATVLAAVLGSLGTLAWHPATSEVWLVVAAAIAAGSYEWLHALRGALDGAVAATGGAARLEAFEENSRAIQLPWPSDCTVHLEGVTISEGSRILLDGVDWTVLAGAHVALTGPSGTGKSTLLRAVAALDDVDAGTVKVGGVSVRDLEEGALRVHVAYVDSEPGLTTGYAVDVVGLGRCDVDVALRDLGPLGLAAERTTRFGELSRGERTRVAIARALVTRPDILLLDEPTAGLGHQDSTGLLSLLSTVTSTVIVATHDPLVLEWCDEVVVLDHADLHRGEQ